MLPLLIKDGLVTAFVASSVLFGAVAYTCVQNSQSHTPQQDVRLREIVIFTVRILSVTMTSTVVGGSEVPGVET